MTRDDMRREARKARRAISAIRRADMSLRVAEAVVALPEFLAAQSVMCYASLPEEVRTDPLISVILDSGRELYLPAIQRDMGLLALRCLPTTRLEPDTMGIRTPVDGEACDPSRLDLVIAPGLAFDRQGNRLGFGKGYYDRFLAECRCPIVALAFEIQLFDRVEARPNDIPVDILVTEKQVYDCAAARAEKIEE